MTRLIVTFCVVLAVLVPWFAPDGNAQTRPAKLLLTVVDQTGAVVPNATVTLMRTDAPAKKPIGPVTSDDKGLATVEDLVPGVYEIQVEFPAFETRVMSDVRLRAGDNRQVAILRIQHLQDEITVGRDKQTAAADPKSTFGTALTREQIEALPDDPDEMRQQIMDMAPDAVLRVDSFEGGQLPPKAQIKSIHVTRDQFAAESHYAGAVFIDVITQPGMGPIRGGTSFRFRDRSLNASNPMTNVKGPEQMRSYAMHVGGTLIRNKSSFSLSINGADFHEAPTIVTEGPEGRRVETLPIKRRRENLFTAGRVDYALTKDQALRVGFTAERFNHSNLGVGQFDEAERAFSTEERWTSVRVQETGPIGRRFFINTRLQMNFQNSDRVSDAELPTIRIVDAKTSGGAQQRGGSRARTLNFMSDLDYVRGIHSFRTGLEVDGTWYHSTEDSNYLGTYTFESIDAYLAGTPRSYTRRIGDPELKYHNVLGAVYIQDDIRIRKSLTLSPGVRYELQTHVSDFNNVAPRFGINWAPFRSGATTIRASAGIFYDWFSTATYEQTLRVDGFRQQELNILNPSYPDPGDIGTVNASNRYLMGDDLAMVRTVRLSAGISQTLTPQVRFTATYSNSHGYGLYRGVNLNTPVEGVRPDARFANVIDIENDARSQMHQLSTSMNVALTEPGQGGAASQQARFNWRRGSINLNYILARQRNNTDGAFRVPFSANLDNEWGPANVDVRHRLNVGMNTQAVKDTNTSVTLSYSSAAPYTIRTGIDANGDLVFNDRPAGVGRNTERGEGSLMVSAIASYTIHLGKRPPAAPPAGGGGQTVINTGDRAIVMSPGGPAGASRYRILFSVSVQNLTNHVNHTGWTGTMTSRFFRQSTSVGAPRKIDLGVSFSF